jgi:nucleotide-binding universal stress UspA family protein
MIEIRQILCPIDFSDHARRALDHAIAIARWYESTVTVTCSRRLRSRLMARARWSSSRLS